ncbi:MAG: Crp/Fnr family transcriptional regulator [Actinomycetota bacterium]
MRKADKIDYLSKVPLFSGFSKKDLGEVARHLDRVEAESGTTLTEEGALAHQFGIIVDGTAEVRRNNRKLAELGPGDFWGEMALLLREKSSATVTTTRDSSVLVMHAREFNHLLDEVPALARKLATGLAARLLEADKQLTV